MVDFFCVSAMKLYSLTVGRLHSLLSIKLAFLYIYFLFSLFFSLFFAKSNVTLFASETHYFPFGISIPVYPPGGVL